VNVVDSSGWVEFFVDGPNAHAFAAPILEVSSLLVPTICLYEVFKVVCKHRDVAAAFQAVAHMRQGIVVDVDANIALQAARFSLELQQPMADSLIYSVSSAHEATLWSQDEDFDGLPGVRYFRRKG